MILDPNGTYLSRKMHIILVNSSLRGTKQSLADRHQTLIDCHATARNDGDFGLSKCHSSIADFSLHAGVMARREQQNNWNDSVVTFVLKFNFWMMCFTCPYS